MGPRTSRFTFIPQVNRITGEPVGSSYLGHCVRVDPSRETSAKLTSVRPVGRQVSQMPNDFLPVSADLSFDSNYHVEELSIICVGDSFKWTVGIRYSIVIQTRRYPRRIEWNGYRIMCTRDRGAETEGERDRAATGPRETELLLVQSERGGSCERQRQAVTDGRLAGSRTIM